MIYESKAELKSRETILVSKPLSKASCKSWVKWRRTSQVPKPYLNPNWIGGKTSNQLTKLKRRLISKRSKILDEMRVIDIGLYSNGVEDFSKFQ